MTNREPPLTDCLRPTELHDFSDLPFRLAPAGGRMLVVLAAIFVLAAAHQTYRGLPSPHALAAAQPAGQTEHIRLD